MITNIEMKAMNAQIASAQALQDIAEVLGGILKQLSMLNARLAAQAKQEGEK